MGFSPIGERREIRALTEVKPINFLILKEIILAFKKLPFWIRFREEIVPNEVDVISYINTKQVMETMGSIS